MRVERRVDLVPEPRRRRHGLAAADLDRQRRGDLVGGAAEDDELPGQLVPQVGQRERRRDYAARNRVVPAGVHRLDRAVRAEDRDGVVEADEADRAARERALQRRAERGLHPRDPALDLEARPLQDLGDVPRALVLLVRELSVLVHEPVRRQGGRPLRLDRHQDPLVVHPPPPRRNRDRQNAPSTSRRPPIGAASGGGAAGAADQLGGDALGELRRQSRGDVCDDAAAVLGDRAA